MKTTRLALNYLFSQTAIAMRTNLQSIKKTTTSQGYNKYVTDIERTETKFCYHASKLRVMFAHYLHNEYNFDYPTAFKYTMRISLGELYRALYTYNIITKEELIEPLLQILTLENQNSERP